MHLSESPSADCCKAWGATRKSDAATRNRLADNLLRLEAREPKGPHNCLGVIGEALVSPAHVEGRGQYAMNATRHVYIATLQECGWSESDNLLQGPSPGLPSFDQTVNMIIAGRDTIEESRGPTAD
jgi:hypothetical protein